ncbi:MAG: protein kinase, partial [Anaerolineae bacterium]|nr:protein kinase [Anaerolineae bacterium]
MDLQVTQNEWWRRDVFIKQYTDVNPNSEIARSLRNHFRKFKERLSDWGNCLCLPIHLDENLDSIIAIYPWLQGETLRDRMSQGLAAKEMARLAWAIARTIRIIHEQKIAHLDLKPENIVITESKGQIYVRLIDLDAARIDGQGIRNEIKGTEFYMSPEHYYPDQFGQVSTKSDLFTLGIMLYELLFGDHPYNHTSNYPQAISEEAFAFPESSYHRQV